MNKTDHNPKENDNYNSIITIVFISILVIIRISINNYKKQNIIIAWINFFSMFYVLWRIYYQVNAFLKGRVTKSVVLKRQYKRFKNFYIFIICALFSLMLVYSYILLVLDTFYQFGGCINDILSLFALLFSIEDEKIVDKAISHYRYV